MIGAPKQLERRDNRREEGQRAEEARRGLAVKVGISEDSTSRG
jgi:hypothetical protein